MDGRTLDKRKARDKETDSETSDPSINKNPMKRPRVEYSPKEKSPSPASAQKSPLGKVGLADSCAAVTPAHNIKAEQNNGEVKVKNASLASAGSPSTGHNNSSQPTVHLTKFDLPSPFTTQELEQKMGKGAVGSGEGNGDSDSDNGSTKFLSGIIQNEEKKKRQVNNNKGGKNSGSDTGFRSNGTTTTPVANSKRSAGTSTNIKLNNLNKPPHQPTSTSSPVSSDLVSENCELEVTIKVVDPNTRQVIFEETVIKSDTERIEGFLKQHNLKLSGPSHSYSSGYLGDVSSETTSSSNKSSGSNRLTTSSLGSTIPRHSIVSIATDMSESPEELMKRPGRPAPVSKARKRSDGPIMSSTKIDDDSSSRSSHLERMNISPNPISNGDDSYSSSGKSQSQSSSPPKKFKNTATAKLIEAEERTPNAASPRRGIINKGTPKGSSATPTTGNDSGRDSAKKPAVRRRGGSSNFPNTNSEPPAGLSAVLSTPPPARSVARIEGTQAKPLSKFEQEMNKEPVVESELQKSETLWSTILPQELVFARWRDRNYYSGMVQSKGLNDTWLIDFDDGMKDVASESHIIPVRILGVGVNGIFSPDDHYEAKQAVIIGQKFQIDPDVGGTAVKYAIKCDGDTQPIWCSRRQLSIKESDAKKLRPEYASIIGGKPGDVSIDNIVCGPRRRTRGEATSEEKSQKKVVGGAFDESVSDAKLLESSTPKARGTPKIKKTPAAEPKKKRSSSMSTNTPQTKDASTSSPAKETPVKGSPTRTPKATTSAIEPLNKKRSKKTLFQGLQFFLTASGGGDPGISGLPPSEATPYDKDEYRELIESCGGEILDTVGNEEKGNVFLISDSYARTVKYIYCLAAGIPCLSHGWIARCLELLEIVEWKVFTLPAGWSLEHQDLIQHHVKKPLKGCKVFVTSESDQLYNYWKPVLTAAEAVLLKPSRKKGQIIPTGTEVVVTDLSDTTQDILEEAEALTVPVVKPEWLVQTIITGEKAHMYGHEKYKILLTESEEGEEFVGDSSVDAGANNDHVNEVLANMQSPD